MTEHNNPPDNITVSRELLQQVLDYVEEGNPGHIADKIKVLVKLRTALEQPAQEPTDAQIALLDPWMRPAAAKELLTKVFAVRQLQLCATPQAQQPVNLPLLTDEEIEEFADDGVFLGNIKEISRAIEQAVLKKNGVLK